MAQTIRCPVCGRENSSSNVRCSACGIAFNFIEQQEKKSIETDVGKALEDVEERLKISSQRINWDFWKPDEHKLLLFVSLFFTTLPLQYIVKEKIIFSITYYPVLYWFTAHWVAKKKIEVWDFLLQLVILVIVYGLIFTVLPSLLFS